MEFFDTRPEIFAILIVILGFVIASILRRLTDRALLALQGRIDEDDVDFGLVRQVVRVLVYYGTLLAFLLMALHVLSTIVVRQWLELLMQYVPQLLLGAFIIFSGYLIGMVARGLLARAMGVDVGHIVPKFAQVLIVFAALLTGLAQTSIDLSFITSVVIILVSFFFGGLSLAFALGSRHMVESLLARRALDRYRVGDRIRVNTIEGRIVEVLGTAVLLETEQGILSIPTLRFVDSEVLLITEEIVDDSDN